MSRDIACDSENLIHIFGRKQKLQLSKVKSEHALLLQQLYTKNAVKLSSIVPAEQIYKLTYISTSEKNVKWECNAWDVPTLHGKTTTHVECEDRSAAWLRNRDQSRPSNIDSQRDLSLQ